MKNSYYYKTLNSNCYKTQNPSFDNNQRVKLQQKSKTKIVI